MSAASAGTVSGSGGGQLYACSGHFQWWKTWESEGIFGHWHASADHRSAAHKSGGTKLCVSDVQTSPLAGPQAHGRYKGLFSINVLKRVS